VRKRPVDRFLLQVRTSDEADRVLAHLRPGGVGNLGLELLRPVLDWRRRRWLELAGGDGEPGDGQALHPEESLVAGFPLVAQAAAREGLAQASLLVAPLALLTDGPAPAGGPARGGRAQGKGGHDGGACDGVRGAGVAGEDGENAQHAERSHGSQSNASSLVVPDLGLARCFMRADRRRQRSGRRRWETWDTRRSRAPAGWAAARPRCAPARTPSALSTPAWPAGRERARPGRAARRECGWPMERPRQFPS